MDSRVKINQIFHDSSTKVLHSRAESPNISYFQLHCTRVHANGCQNKNPSKKKLNPPNPVVSKDLGLNNMICNEHFMEFQDVTRLCNADELADGRAAF